MCQRLALEQLEMNFVGCPTTQQLNELTQNIKFLEAETVCTYAFSCMKLCIYGVC